MVLIVFIWMQIRFYDDLVIIAHDSCYCFDISQIFCFLKQFCCKGMSEGMSTVDGKCYEQMSTLNKIIV
ncbi:hypothetical protein L0P51_22580, partial [Acetatifactor sp. DFI.5.50]|nr:hypothetical protein [Acetatifactor sp. DFI.5.50]